MGQPQHRHFMAISRSPPPTPATHKSSDGRSVFGQVCATRLRQHRRRRNRVGRSRRCIIKSDPRRNALVAEQESADRHAAEKDNERRKDQDPVVARRRRQSPDCFRKRSWSRWSIFKGPRTVRCRLGNARSQTRVPALCRDPPMEQRRRNALKLLRFRRIAAPRIGTSHVCAGFFFRMRARVGAPLHSLLSSPVRSKERGFTLRATEAVPRRGIGASFAAPPCGTCAPRSADNSRRERCRRG